MQVDSSFEINDFLTHVDPSLLEKSQQILTIIEPYQHAKSLQLKHPVLDFLFEYYSFSANKLLTFNPGFKVSMPADWTPSDYRYSQDSDGQWSLLCSDFPAKRLNMVNWVLSLLDAIESRPKAFGCYGLHEWAMVYRIDQVRHDQLNLRLSSSEIADFVKSQPIKCSHFDAYRFFTPEAQPLNQLRPTYDQRLEMEQGGCIHANMDLYKWTYKLHPWLGSDLLWDAFLLAHETRYFDMQASPYDLSAYGLSPIPIETPEGRQTYVNGQKSIAERAEMVRRNLISALKELRTWATST
ncbi:MAG TPA: hypothetical protein DCE78_06255 [Bacteroidetes bacterium]|nr:hypothetical protein [Bacteroidota bacterium]